jgi:hypothetical protein
LTRLTRREYDPVCLPVLALRSSVSGGALPKVNSLRQEGGTVYLQQSHADVDIGLVYLIRQHAEVGLGYHFTYFVQGP